MQLNLARPNFHARAIILGLGGWGNWTFWIHHAGARPFIFCHRAGYFAMETRKVKFIEELTKAFGIISVACQYAGVGRSTYYHWRDTDPDFRKAVEDVMEIQGDFVESKLLENIKDNDTQSILFYCKTKLKKRGYTEKPLPKEESEPLPEYTLSPAQDEAPRMKPEIVKRVERKKKYLVNLLKKEGKYTSELSMQAGLVAQLLVKTDMLAAEILADTHEAVTVEYSREGNRRESVSVKERLYLDYVAKSQKALRALGMNTDSRERKGDGKDSFDDFLNMFRDDD